MDQETLRAVFESMGKLHFTADSLQAQVDMLKNVINERDKQIATLQEALTKENPPQTAKDIPKTPDVPL